MSIFDIIVKHEGKKVQKVKVDDLDDFDPILQGLKEKFGGKPKPIRKKRGLF